MKTKVIIVEDEVLIARHIEEVLIDGGIQVLGITHDSERALDLISSQRPDLIILDINIEGSKDGIEVGEIVKKQYQIPIIFLTALSDLQTIDRAKMVNPVGYIVKPFKPSDLLVNITIGLFNNEQQSKGKEITIDDVNRKSKQSVTEVEFEIILDIMQGFTNGQIAKKRFVALSTIKWHTNNIYSKFSVKNRTSLIKVVMS